MMDPQRQLQLFRAMVKEQLRIKGIRLSGSFGREMSSEVSRLNERLNLDTPLKDEEFVTLYLELAKELFKEHCDALTAKFLSDKKAAD